MAELTLDAPAEAEVEPRRAGKRRTRPKDRLPGWTGRLAIRWTLRLIVVAYLFLLVAWPVSLVVTHTFEGGTESLRGLLEDPDIVHALQLTVICAISAVVINTIFGVGMSMLLVRQEFPGKRVLSALVDLPLSVSPVVVGLALVLVYGGRDGWFGPTLESAGLQVIFSTPGIIMATAFVALPLVIREVVPVLDEIGTDQEVAAQSLGANSWQVFWRITLPAIKWAVVYGVVLSLARSLGEFGAVKVVSGNVLGRPARPRWSSRRSTSTSTSRAPTPRPSCSPWSPWPASSSSR
ncbi:sulfate ABC transporter permease subunit [Nocardioides alcanivorans]|uniref:sulfate ABC transporter permease subunit n=1 Tax=Nocardioides alcanivorans TaxID=2897352 RepID=UPI001F22FDD9|nr:sulfate ABC transporter permease subunit [Nocardioides alcanivorans]